MFINRLLNLLQVIALGLSQNSGNNATLEIRRWSKQVQDKIFSVFSTRLLLWRDIVLISTILHLHRLFHFRLPPIDVYHLYSSFMQQPIASHTGCNPAHEKPRSFTFVSTWVIQEDASTAGSWVRLILATSLRFWDWLLPQALIYQNTLNFEELFTPLRLVQITSCLCYAGSNAGWSYAARFHIQSAHVHMETRDTKACAVHPKPVTAQWYAPRVYCTRSLVYSNDDKQQ